MVDTIPLFKNQENFKNVMGIFANKGFHSTTMDEIAKSMGVAKGTLYYHYKNKEELYYSVIKAGNNVMIQSVELALLDAKDAKQKVSQLIKALLTYFESYADVTFIYLRELYGNNIRRDVLFSMVNEVIKIIESILNEGKKEGIFQVVDIETTATSIFGAISTTAIHFLNQNGAIACDEISKQIEQLIFNGLINKVSCTGMPATK